VSDPIQQAIDSLEQEIEALDQRRGELQRAVAASQL
jgi:prefoldin subunit 5